MTAPGGDGVRGGPQHIPRPPGVFAGDPAPWAGLPPDRRRPDAARLREAFAVIGPPRPSPRAAVAPLAAAVLAACFEEDGELFVVLTRRSGDLRVHSGEVAFPGGRQEPGEDLATTACREAWEEVGLEPASVEIVGELDHLSTISSRSYIAPFVGLLAARPTLVANPSEVDAVLIVACSELLADGVFREERWPIFGADRPIVFFELVGDTVWGATAAMLRQLLGILTDTVGRGGLGHD
ncbi:MAG: CoA pyrophosphatase [Actinobacteria bacterium]|nr:CoA pyrophosphatase [Actinomycetota bacterium]